MIKKINILFVYIAMMFILSACSSPETEDLNKIAEEGISGLKPPKGFDVINNIDKFDEVTENQSYNRDTDADRNFNRLTTGVTDTGDILYAVSGGDWIIYCDKKTGSSGLLCGKPDCGHVNEECNAYMVNCWGIQYYNGYLYTVQSDRSDDVFKLKKISTDGSEREDLGKLVDKDTITDGGQSIVWAIHRGYIYYVYQLAVQAEDTYYLNNSNCVYRRSLEKDSKPECIMPLPLQSWFGECEFIGTGSYVYMLIPTADNKEDCSLYRLNTETGKLEWFKEWGNNIRGAGVHNNKIYYLESDRGAEKFKMYFYNPETEEKSVLFETEGISAGMSYDDDYIYITVSFDNDVWKREVWSWEGIHLADMEFSSDGISGDDGRIRGLAGSDEERIYISCILKDEENIYNVPIMGMPIVIEYIEKEDISDGEYKLKEWSDMGTKNK